MTCICYSVLLISLFIFFLSDIPHLAHIAKPLYSKKTLDAEKERSRFDYAASDPGGLIVGHSAGISGAKNILKRDKDKYMLVPCLANDKWVEISLLETILIDEVQFVQGEIYSSSFEFIEIEYSIDYPAESWTHLITLRLLDTSKSQKFKVNPTWVRFLRLVLVSHYRNEYYCTLTQFSAFGSTIFQSLNEDYMKEKEKMKNKTENLAIEDEENEKDDQSWFFERTWYVKEFENETSTDPQELDPNITSLEICKPSFYYESTCESISNDIQIYPSTKELKESINVFGEMIKHMAKSETKIEQLYVSMNRFYKLQKNYDEKFKLLEKHFALLELQVLVNQENIENLKFWMFFFTFLFLVGMLLIAYITGREGQGDSDDARSVSPRKRKIVQSFSVDLDYSDSEQGKYSAIKKIIKKHTR